MQGNLADMHIADLIQHACLDRKQARLRVQNKDDEAEIYFQDGQIVHAAMDGVEGKEVIFRILNWQEGSFDMTSEVRAPKQSITANWTELLLEGARRLDEASVEPIEEVPQMATKKKSEVLAEMLETLLAESSDITGAAIVGVDGLVYSANVPQKSLDEAIVGAASAAILGLSKRSVQQLQRGKFKQTLIQGDDGNIIVAPLDAQTFFVALTPSNTNLGMAFAEVRSIAEKLGDVL